MRYEPCIAFSLGTFSACPHSPCTPKQVQCFSAFMRYVGAKHRLGLVQAFQEQEMTPGVNGLAPQNYYYSQY